MSSFKFVSGSLQSDVSADAPTLAGENLGGVLIEQEKMCNFAIANTDTVSRQYTVSTSGDNTSIFEDVNYSINKIDWDLVATVSGVPAGRVSPTIYVSYKPSSGTPTVSGTFLIRVDES